MKRAAMLAAISFIAISTSAQFMDQAEVPAYHATAPKPGEKLAPILKPGPGFQYPFQVHAYQTAAKISKVLYQMPCYCYCDRSKGHTSLHSCFASEHGAQCETCMQELFYTQKMLEQHKTVKQIRAGIERGEWKSIDLQKM